MWALQTWFQHHVAWKTLELSSIFDQTSNLLKKPS